MAKGSKRPKLFNKTNKKKTSGGNSTTTIGGKMKTKAKMDPQTRKKMNKLYPGSIKKISDGLLSQRHKFERKTLKSDIDILFEQRSKVPKTLQGKEKHRELTNLIHQREEMFEKRIKQEFDLFKDGNLQLLLKAPTDLYSLRGQIQTTEKSSNLPGNKFSHLLVGASVPTHQNGTKSTTQHTGPNFDLVYAPTQTVNTPTPPNSTHHPGDEEEEESVFTSTGTPESFLNEVQMKKSEDQIAAESKAIRRKENKLIRDEKRLKNLRSHGRTGPFVQYLG